MPPVAAEHLDEDLLIRHLASELGAAESQALSEHLHDCPRCRRVAAELVRSDERTDDEPIVGRSFSGWQVEGLLGAGSFSEVYLARHPSLGRACALKVLKTAQSREQARRLLDEARAVNRIRHPGIVDVFGSGTTPDGRPYLLMELLEGETLEALLARRESLPPEEAMVLLQGILEPLDAAHRKGVLHRDLKPGNVFVGPARDGRPTLKLLDFGLAKQGIAIEGLAASTRGRIVGTPAYMAPEQFLDGGAVGPPTDLYAVGITAYELLTGSVPFSGPSFMKVMAQHAQQQPPPLPPHVPAALAGWVMHLLVKEPTARPRSAQVALANLERIRRAAEELAASAPTERAAAPVLVPDPTVPHLPAVRAAVAPTQSLRPTKPRGSIATKTTRLLPVVKGRSKRPR